MITSDVPPAKEATGEPSAATRHLCTGVYVDERFRDLVIDKVCTAPHRRVAPSYGFDIVPVMHHAWRAAALNALLRMTLVGAAVTPAVAGALPTSILVICGLAFLWLLRLTMVLRKVDWEPRPRQKPKRRGLGPARGRRHPFRPFPPRRHSEKGRALRRIGAAALSLALTGLTVALAHPGHATMALQVAAGIMLMCLSIGAARQLVLDHILRASSLRPTRLSGRQRAADLQQRHVCAVYRRPRHSEDEGEDEDDLTMFTLFGDESPFIGAGELVYQWNPPMSIQLLRPGNDEAPLHEREHPVPPFQAHELVEYLREAVQLLDSDSQEVRLPTQVRDRIYVAETDVAVDRSLLPQEFDEADLRDIINTPGTKQHHFLEVVTPTAGSEFVATVMLHVSLQGRTLMISTAACVLAHTPRSFQQTEEFGHHGAMAVIWAAFRELAALPLEIQNSWRIARYFYTLSKAAVLPRDLTSIPIRNVLIGSRISVRERSAQTWSKIQLEKSDILGRMKTIERRLLRAASDFLHARDVDISEFNDRALKIINSGIFNFGDNNNFNNNAVGNEAQVGVSANQPTGSNPNSGGHQ
ncbi:hypothetical protein [Streptomyces syringium]|uniref:Uncharacterized protein n=1 Tax=Streptomyces syringium TaxID=76729 RepID=A0ABS4YA31_9ACTN|nr:hypothetical protein [Streptomyces syringium]MBP2405659.1 hypothetical protein [Streptomyces syringium]